ncbi:MAG TPA: hypothetical protein VGG28_02745 [Kofleriaceae bacterium]
MPAHASLPATPEVSRDARDPGTDSRAVAQAPEVAPRFDEGFLGDVLGLRDIADTAQCDGEHEPLVLFHQPCERARLTGKALPDELVIGRFGHRRS